MTTVMFSALHEKDNHVPTFATARVIISGLVFNLYTYAS